MNLILERIGNFTSSEIVALTKRDPKGINFGAPALTYIEECNMERQLGRSISTDTSSRPTSWGKLIEKFLFEKKLGTEYQLLSQESVMHPTINCWAGSPDGKKFVDTVANTVVEIKSPFTLKSFCQLANKSMFAIRKNHKEGEKYYHQILSNAILTGCEYAELIVYCPYKEDLQEIRDYASNIDGPEQKDYYWITQADDEELPYLIKGNFYKDLNIIPVDVPAEDRDFLTKCVLEAQPRLFDRANASAASE